MRPEEYKKEILAETRRSDTLRSSDTVVQQMPLKPAVFHGQVDFIKEITLLHMEEGASRVCRLGPRWDRKDFMKKVTKRN